MKLIVGILIGASLSAVIAVIALGEKKKIELSTDISATKVFLVNESSGGGTKFTIYREDKPLFTANVVSNSFNLIVREKSAEPWDPFHKLFYSQSEQEGETHYQLNTSKKTDANKWRMSEFDIEKGELKQTKYISESGVVIRDKDDQVIEVFEME